MAEEEKEQKRAMPEFPFFLERPTPVRDLILGERRILGSKGKLGLKRGPLQREGGEGGEGGGESLGPLGFLPRPNGVKPLERIRGSGDGGKEGNDPGLLGFGFRKRLRGALRGEEKEKEG